MATNKTLELDQAIRGYCPNIYGVSMGDPNDRSTWSIQFMPSATADQISAANAALLTVTIN